MATLTIAPVADAFPEFRVAVVVLAGLDLAGGANAGIEAALTAAEDDALALLDRTELADIPSVAAWRRAYKRFGIKQTRYRNSLERLLRRLRGGQRLPRINPLVDLYNAVSLAHRMPAGADDLDRVTPPIAFRFGGPADSFLDMGVEPPAEDPPRDGEVVLADAVHVLCRRWNWRQDARTMIRPETRRAVLTVQALDPADDAPLRAAADAVVALATRHLAATGAWVVADRDTPTVDLPGSAA